MSKKKNDGASARKGLRGWAWVALGVLLVAAVWGGNQVFKPAAGQGRSFQVKGGETRPLLHPLTFPGRDSIMAYTAAAQYPEVMDQVFCYCGCDQPPNNHKSLLSCFTDSHGST